jgi:hypothetical protein
MTALHLRCNALRSGAASSGTRAHAYFAPESLAFIAGMPQSRYSSGGGGIRTHEPPYDGQRFSRPPRFDLATASQSGMQRIGGACAALRAAIASVLERS